MDFAQTRPAAHLRPFVASYVGYRESGVPARTHRGLPSPYLTLILTLDDPLWLTDGPDRTERRGYEALIGGLHTAPAHIVHDGRQSGIQLALTPAGARALFGLPASELAHLDTHLAQVVGGVPALRERLLHTDGWPGRFVVLDRWLTARLDPTAAPGAEVAQAWRLLTRAPALTRRPALTRAPALDQRSPLDGRPTRDRPAALDGRPVPARWPASAGGPPAAGIPSVAAVARHVGWSTRHLQARFTAEFGLTPKVAARVARFDRARHAVADRFHAGVSPALAELAAVHGYADQAHLTREFTALAGCPPGRWLDEEFRNVQAGGAAPPPDWAA